MKSLVNFSIRFKSVEKLYLLKAKSNFAINKYSLFGFSETKMKEGRKSSFVKSILESSNASTDFNSEQGLNFPKQKKTAKKKEIDIPQEPEINQSDYESSSENLKQKERHLYENSFIKSYNFKTIMDISGEEESLSREEGIYKIEFEDEHEQGVDQYFKLAFNKDDDFDTRMVTFINNHVIQKEKNNSLFHLNSKDMFTKEEILEYRITQNNIETLEDFVKVILILNMKKIINIRSTEHLLYDGKLTAFLEKYMAVKDDLDIFFFVVKLNTHLNLSLVDDFIFEKLKKYFQVPLQDNKDAPHLDVLTSRKIVKKCVLYFPILFKHMRKIHIINQRDKTVFKNMILSFQNLSPYIFTHSLSDYQNLIYFSRSLIVFQILQNEYKVLKTVLLKEFKLLKIDKPMDYSILAKFYTNLIKNAKDNKPVDIAFCEEVFVNFLQKLKEAEEKHIIETEFYFLAQVYLKLINTLLIENPREISRLESCIRESLIRFFKNAEYVNKCMSNENTDKYKIDRAFSILDLKNAMKIMARKEDKLFEKMMSKLNLYLKKELKNFNPYELCKFLDSKSDYILESEKKELMLLLYKKLEQLKNAPFEEFVKFNIKFLNLRPDEEIIKFLKSLFMAKLFYISLNYDFDKIDLVCLFSCLNYFYEGKDWLKGKIKKPQIGNLVPSQSTNLSEIKSNQYSLHPQDFANLLENVFKYLTNNKGTALSISMRSDFTFQLINFTFSSIKAKHLLQTYFYNLIHPMLVFQLRSVGDNIKLCEFCEKINRVLPFFAQIDNNLEMMTYILKIQAKSIHQLFQKMKEEENTKNKNTSIKKNFVKKILNNFYTIYILNPAPYEAVAKKRPKLQFLNYILRKRHLFCREFSGKGKFDIVKIKKVVPEKEKDKEIKNETLNRKLTDNFFFSN